MLPDRAGRVFAVALAMLAAAGVTAAQGDESPAEDDWSLPAWVMPSPTSGFFSEEADPAFEVHTRVVDLTWRQLQPTPGGFSTATADEVYGMTFPSWDEQLSVDGPFWLRLWVSGAEWAPQWVQDECGVDPVGTGYEGDEHLPLWDACLWGHARELYREVLLDRGLLADPRLRLVYVPGAFTWCELDFDVVEQAVENGDLELETFDAWFRQAVADLVTIANGEPDDPGDDLARKLVYTGEDYPFGPFGAADDLYARDAVAAGMGIRTGITEVFNFHLSDVPAYGARIAADGHVVTDDSWPLLDGVRVVATENECFNDCGFSTDTPYYAVKMAELKALQLRVNWLYVKPEESSMASYPELWRWVRLSLGKTARTSADAWVALREAEDTYWLEDDAVAWPDRPWVRNWERWLVQREVAPDGLTGRGSEVRSGVLAPENGTAYEGRTTRHAQGSDCIYLDLDDAFLHDPPAPAAVDVKVTYRDTGTGPFVVEYASAGGVSTSAPVARTGSGAWRTATVTLPDGSFDGSLPGGTDLRLCRSGGADLEVRFVRVVKRDPPPASPPPRRPRGRRTPP